MEFCPDCDGILLPKKGTNELYCRICNKSFKVEKKKTTLKTEYKIKRSIPRRIYAKTAVLDKKEESPTISDDDRSAYEDYFRGDGS